MKRQPTELLEEILLDTGVCPRFVETGTGDGEGVALALEFFQEVLSCDSDARRIGGVGAKCDGARLSVDTSPHFLANLQKGVDTVYWLDAHGPGCPLLEELDVIFARLWTKNSIVLVNDLHVICAGVDWAHGICLPLFDKVRKLPHLVVTFYPNSFNVPGAIMMLEHE